MNRASKPPAEHSIARAKLRSQRNGFMVRVPPNAKLTDAEERASDARIARAA
jgi:hypothetical protein